MASLISHWLSRSQWPGRRVQLRASARGWAAMYLRENPWHRRRRSGKEEWSGARSSRGSHGGRVGPAGVRPHVPALNADRQRIDGCRAHRQRHAANRRCRRLGRSVQVTAGGADRYRRTPGCRTWPRRVSTARAVPTGGRIVNPAALEQYPALSPDDLAAMAYAPADLAIADTRRRDQRRYARKALNLVKEVTGCSVIPAKRPDGMAGCIRVLPSEIHKAAHDTAFERRRYTRRPTLAE